MNANDVIKYGLDRATVQSVRDQAAAEAAKWRDSVNNARPTPHLSAQEVACAFLERAAQCDREVADCDAVLSNWPKAKEPTFVDRLMLVAVVRESLSPDAVALIIAHLQGVENREVKWVVDALTEAVGGVDAANKLFDEVGV